MLILCIFQINVYIIFSYFIFWRKKAVHKDDVEFWRNRYMPVDIDDGILGLYAYYSETRLKINAFE